MFQIEHLNNGKLLYIFFASFSISSLKMRVDCSTQIACGVRACVRACVCVCVDFLVVAWVDV